MIRPSVKGAPGRHAPREVVSDIAALVFLAVLIVALVLFVVFGRSQWFFHDEWDFLAKRNASSLNDLFRPHNEHWSTLPILVYRVLWHFFGLRTYVPYQLVTILLHLTAAVLLRVVMRRAGVNPWIATAAASLFALFGAGDRGHRLGVSDGICWIPRSGTHASHPRRPRRPHRSTRHAGPVGRACGHAVLGRRGHDGLRRGLVRAHPPRVACRVVPHRAIGPALSRVVVCIRPQ